MPSTLNSTSCRPARRSGDDRSASTTGGRRVVKIERLARHFAGDGVRPVGREAVLLRISAGSGVQPAVGHHHDVAQGVGQRVVVRPRRERRVHQQRRPSSGNPYGCGVPGGISPWPIACERLAGCGVAATRFRARQGPEVPAHADRSPAVCSRPGRSTIASAAIDRAPRSQPSNRLPIGSNVGWAAVSCGRQNAKVSSARGLQMLRARPMKSTREVRNPSGAMSAARMPRALECLSQASTACKAARIPFPRTGGCIACAPGRRPAD